MSRLDPRSLLADTTFGVMRAYTSVYNRFHLPVISTARPFSFYRDIFFDGRGERAVLEELAGKTVVDVGCGLTPFVSDSAFQVCNAHGVNFYGVDPKLDDQFRFGAFDRFKVRATGGRGRFDRNAAFRERMLAAPAERIPLGNARVDLILSSWLLFVWIDDEAALARIFNEFHRLLRRGGEVRLYPQRAWRAQAIRHAPLRKALARFSVRQQFKASRAALPVTPAYMTVLRK